MALILVNFIQVLMNQVQRISHKNVQIILKSKLNFSMFYSENTNGQTVANKTVKIPMDRLWPTKLSKYQWKDCGQQNRQNTNGKTVANKTVKIPMERLWPTKLSNQRVHLQKKKKKYATFSFTS